MRLVALVCLVGLLAGLALVVRHVTQALTSGHVKSMYGNYSRSDASCDYWLTTIGFIVGLCPFVLLIILAALIALGWKPN